MPDGKTEMKKEKEMEKKRNENYGFNSLGILCGYKTGCLAAAINREEFDSPNHTAHIETKVVMIALLPSFNRASKERGFIGYIGSKV